MDECEKGKQPPPPPPNDGIFGPAAEGARPPPSFFLPPRLELRRLLHAVPSKTSERMLPVSVHCSLQRTISGRQPSFIPIMSTSFLVILQLYHLLRPLLNLSLR
jgi:hypothetical protein